MKDKCQYFTKNPYYIFTGFDQYISNKDVIDPFAGEGDLLFWARNAKANSISGFDIDEKLINDLVKYNDSLLNCPKANFIITNPPFLAKNKSKNHTYFGNEKDLYIVALNKIIESDPDEGILILPLNFLSSNDSLKIRKKFFEKYDIVSMNLFKIPVFEDTRYTIISFYFKRGSDIDKTFTITSFPDGSSKEFTLSKKYNYIIGGEYIYKILGHKKSIKRLTIDIIEKNPGSKKIRALLYNKKTKKTFYVSDYLYYIIRRNKIFVTCIDLRFNNKIRAENITSYGVDCFIGKKSSRNCQYLLSNFTNQDMLIDLFNNRLNFLRNKYDSLFLTSYMDFDKKRLSFEFCNQLFNYIKG